MTEIKPSHAWSGSRYIDVLDPRPEDMDPVEIATGLSREGRYGANATRVFWSVAQHSLLCDHLALLDGVTDIRSRRTLLMHDAPEYMLRDIIRPVKKYLPGYDVLEMDWWSAIAERFGLHAKLPPLVKYYDLLACAVEKRYLISNECGDWPGIESEPKAEIPSVLLALSMDQARDMFLSRLAALT